MAGRCLSPLPIEFARLVMNIAIGIRFAEDRRFLYPSRGFAVKKRLAVSGQQGAQLEVWP